jgi:hypothetical protein
LVSIGVYYATAGVPITIYGGAVSGAYYDVALILQGAMR